MFGWAGASGTRMCAASHPTERCSETLVSRPSIMTVCADSPSATDKSWDPTEIISSHEVVEVGVIARGGDVAWKAGSSRTVRPGVVMRRHSAK